MNLSKIGVFIAKLRKEQNLTQEQLGEILGVTNKTVSRWETGKYLPPAEVLQQMSTLFDVSINEILHGQRLAEADYKAAAEENLRTIIQTGAFSYKEKIEYYKAKWKKEHRAVISLTIILPLALLFAGILIKQTALIAGAVILFPLTYAWLYNAMMIYVEQRAFNGLGSAEENT